VYSSNGPATEYSIEEKEGKGSKHQAVKWRLN
jgi:hypothetical protein